MKWMQLSMAILILGRYTLVEKHRRMARGGEAISLILGSDALKMPHEWSQLLACHALATPGLLSRATLPAI